MPLPAPEFSVVVATFERPHKLTPLLRALAAQTFERDRFEVLLVNDGGHTPLAPVLDRFGATLHIRLLEQQNLGPGAARNRGVAQARGTVVAFTDDDCEPVPEWLATLHRAFMSYPDAMIGGIVRNALTANSYSAASQRIGDIVYAFYNAEPVDARFFSSNNMAAPTAKLRALGGFDERFRIASEDRDLCERWRSAGLRLVYVPEAVVLHSHDLTLVSFCRQHFRYGQGAALFHLRRTALGSSRLEDHIGLHRQWREWLLEPWSTSPKGAAARMTALLLLWQAVNAAGFAWGRIALHVRRRT
jgi:GT2 family glycosyltransferase